MHFEETKIIELKGIVTDDIKKEIIAFANANGGTIYVGVENNGNVVGVRSADKTIQQISSKVRDAIKPDVTMFIHYDTIKANDKTVVKIDIQRGTQRPYYLAAKGLRPEGVYVRQGTSAAPSTDTAIRQMIKETDGDSFEAMRSLEQELTFTAAEKEFSIRNLEFNEPQRQTLKLISSDGIYTNLGFLLSDECSHTVKVAVFEGTDQSVFKDRREFSGSLFKQLEDVYSFIDLNNPIKATFNKLLRIDSRAYPDVAVREALLNSLVHRDYSFSSSTLISIYTDRIEFVSIGGLMPGIAIDDIMMGVSVCRNPGLANVFYRLQLVEAYGTGMKKIRNAYKDAKIQPVVENSNNAFKIVLPNLNVKSVSNRSMSENEVVVISIAEEKGEITRADVENKLGVSTSTASRLLRRMVNDGLLSQNGVARSTKYYPIK